MRHLIALHPRGSWTSFQVPLSISAPYSLSDGKYQIAQDPDVAMVVVSVRVPTHLEAIVPAIEAGKDVLVE